MSKRSQRRRRAATLRMMARSWRSKKIYGYTNTGTRIVRSVTLEELLRMKEELEGMFSPKFTVTLNPYAPSALTERFLAATYGGPILHTTTS